MTQKIKEAIAIIKALCYMKPENITVELLESTQIEIEKLSNALKDAPEWIEYNKDDKDTYPPKYNRYLISRKDDKIHWEIWNGMGWAYNGNEIRYWMRIALPKADN